MKALETTLGPAETKGQTPSQKDVVTHGTKTPDSLYARLRRLEARVEQLELKASLLRRDVDRVDRRDYRNLKRPSVPIPPGETTPPGETSFAGLFGIEV